MIYPPDDQDLVREMNFRQSNLRSCMDLPSRRLPFAQRWRCVKPYVRWYERAIVLGLLLLALVGAVSLLARL